MGIPLLGLYPETKEGVRPAIHEIAKETKLRITEIKVIIPTSQEYVEEEIEGEL